jgi:hypothetical protein
LYYVSWRSRGSGRQVKRRSQPRPLGFEQGRVWIERGKMADVIILPRGTGAPQADPLDASRSLVLQNVGCAISVQVAGNVLQNARPCFRFQGCFTYAGQNNCQKVPAHLPLITRGCYGSIIHLGEIMAFGIGLPFDGR